MKFTKKTVISMGIICALLLGLTFMKQHQLKTQETSKQPSEQKTESGKFQGMKFIENGTAGNLQGISYQILSAECCTEIRDEDGYYEARGKIEPEIAFWTNPSKSEVVYRQELTYTYLTVEMKNESQESRMYNTMDFRLGNIENQKMQDQFDYYDYRTWNEDGEEIDWDFCLEPGEICKLELAYVTFLPSSYDLYLSIPANPSDDKTYLCMNLGLLQPIEKERDLALLKTYGFTNYDLAKNQTEGSVVLDKYFHGSDEIVGDMNHIEEFNEIYDSRKYQILDVKQYASYEELPESFQNRPYLEKMRQEYQNRYGFSEDELSYLVISVRLEQLQNAYDSLTVTTSQLMWLYNRKEDDTIWKIGYPDDYEIKNGEDGEFVHKNYYEEGKGTVSYLTAAYIIWPGALEDVYLWTKEGAVREGTQNTYNIGMDTTQRYNGGGIHVELP